MILTYIVVVLYSFTINKIINIFLSLLVPVIGFTLSTLSLNIVRKMREKKRTFKVLFVFRNTCDTISIIIGGKVC